LDHYHQISVHFEQHLDGSLINYLGFETLRFTLTSIKYESYHFFLGLFLFLLLFYP